MNLENQTVIMWTNETDNINDVLYKLREKKANVYMASFPRLSETVVFIGNNIYALEQMKVILDVK